MKYNYDAMNSSGEEESGDLEALNTEEAISKIRTLGLFPTRVRKTPTSVFDPIFSGTGKKKISPFADWDLDTKSPLTTREKLMMIFICLLLILIVGIIL